MDYARCRNVREKEETVCTKAVAATKGMLLNNGLRYRFCFFMGKTP